MRKKPASGRDASAETQRLELELQQARAETRDALERESATAEILKVIARSRSDVQPVFDAIAQASVRLIEGFSATVLRIVDGSFHLAASTSTTPAGDESLRNFFPRPIAGGTTGNAARSKAPAVCVDTETDPDVPSEGRALARARGYRSNVVVPMILEGAVIGVITVSRRDPGGFAERQIELLKTFADQAVIAIENVRLFNELQVRTEALSKSVQQLTALGEVGQTISSTLDLETVLKAIVAHAVELTGLDGGMIYEFDEPSSAFRLRASLNISGDLADYYRRLPIRLGEGIVGKTAQTREPVQVSDIEETSYQARFREILLREGYRAMLAVPILREEHIVGAITLSRRKPGGFAPEVVELLKTFASQSALAIQNARLFREIAKKGRQLEEASRHKSQFLANMSHELRTPLNAIIGVTEMLLEDARELKRDEELEPLDRVLRAGQHLLALINDILDLSKIEAGKMELQLESFTLAPLIEDVAQTIRPLAQKNGNSVVTSYDAELGEIHADPTRVRQALLNLASNASKFTERGTVTIDARRMHEDSGGWITLSVKDTGIGMTPEQVGRLFQDFVQADATTTRKYGGTGLGLAISQRFCQMMGGDISVQSAPGAGSTFTIRLPGHAAQSPDGVAAVAGVRHTVAAADDAPVLVVDDDPTTRSLMERYLVREGFSVVTASGGLEGLRLARELHPAAITLDVMMPDLDGWTVLAALKGDPELSDIPVILMTIADDKGRGYSLGATEYLVKPINREKLITVLRDTVRVAGGDALVIDDDPDMRALVSQTLQNSGWTVRTAGDGAEGLEALAAGRPDVIVLDLLMPTMDGFEFLNELREQPQWRDIPVLVLTAKKLSEEERRRLDSDVQRVLQKDSSTRDGMLQEVRDALARCVRQTAARKLVRQAV